ncbi:MAG: tyrosine-type recombinase/integrase [Desulfobacterales bacterium]|nr:tyrosine-type recombinase/integrase [Desulfobacterales bacterium]
MRLFKRGNTYYIEFERSNKRSLHTSDEREAKRLFKIAKQEWLKGKIIKLNETDRITLNRFMEEYLKSRRHDLSSSTLRMDSIALRSFADSVGDIPLRLINETHIEKFKSDCLARGVKKISVNSYLRQLKASLNNALDKGYIKAKIKIKKFRIGKRLPKILTSAEIKMISGYSAGHDPEMYRYIIFALWTGCRREEIRNLTWQKTDGDTARIIGKGNRERIIYLLEPARDAMGEPKDIGPMFAQIHPDTITHRFKAICRACGIEDVHFHNLRHSSATKMVESGIPLEVIQKILGHSDIATTQIYAQIFDKTVKQEMQKLKF